MNAMRTAFASFLPTTDFCHPSPETAAMTAQFHNRFAALSTDLFLMPAVTLGDPTPKANLEVLRTLLQSGADAFALTLPFSDPSAHAPDCAHASVRALAAGTTVEDALRIVRTIRADAPETPLLLTLYANQLSVLGAETFARTAAEAGVDTLLVPDLPVGMRELEPAFDEAAAAAGIGLGGLLPLNALRTDGSHESGTLTRLLRFMKSAPIVVPMPSHTENAVTRTLANVQTPVLLDADHLPGEVAADAMRLGQAIRTAVTPLCQAARDAGTKHLLGVTFGVGIAKILAETEEAANPTDALSEAARRALATFAASVKVSMKAALTAAP